MQPAVEIRFDFERVFLIYISRFWTTKKIFDAQIHDKQISEQQMLYLIANAVYLKRVQRLGAYGDMIMSVSLGWRIKKLTLFLLYQSLMSSRTHKWVCNLTHRKNWDI